MFFFSFFDVCGFFYLAKSRVWRRDELGNYPLGKSGFMWSGAPGEIVGGRPRFLPRNMMSPVVFPREIHFIEYILLATSSLSWWSEN